MMKRRLKIRRNLAIIMTCCIFAATLISCTKDVKEQPQVEAGDSTIDNQTRVNITSSLSTEAPQTADSRSEQSQSEDSQMDGPQSEELSSKSQSSKDLPTKKNPATQQPDTVRNSDVKDETNKDKINKEEIKEANDFRELKPDEISDEVAEAIGFEAVRYYQKDDCIYLLTYTGPKSSEKNSSYRMYPSCNEIWTFNTKTKELAKLFVKYDYNFGNSRQGSNYNHVSGLILSIDDIDPEGNVYFTEKWNEGMEHYGNRKFKYVCNENKIITLSFQAGRPEIYSSDQAKNICNEVFTSEILNQFYQIAKIIDKDNGKTSFTYFNDDIIYGVMYNLQNANREYYHEISRYDIQSGICTPIIQKKLPGRDEDPFIFIQDEDISGIITIKDWCGFNTDFMANQMYFYDPVRKSIKLAESAVETGEYVVVER